MFRLTTPHCRCRSHCMGGGSCGSQRMTKNRVRYLVGPTLHSWAFELGAMAAYLVREAFLSLLLASCFCRCNYQSRLQPSLQSVVFVIFVCGLFSGMVIKPHQNHGIYSRCRLIRERVFWQVYHVVSQECQCKTFLCVSIVYRSSVTAICAPCVNRKKIPVTFQRRWRYAVGTIGFIERGKQTPSPLNNRKRRLWIAGHASSERSKQMCQSIKFG